MPTPFNNHDIAIEGLDIIRQIGQGGMSVVYLAQQHEPKRKIAVKVLRQKLNNQDKDLQRFTNEAHTIAQLSHPNIIIIYKTGATTTGERYFTMPYLEHGDFGSYLYEDDKSFIQLLKTICEGLDFAHKKGIIHRDIKPENLLFDEGGHIKIADFGVAQSQKNSKLTEEHHIIGSARYMSPEQTRSSKVDLRTDIYSLGIVIYEKLTGKVPFDSEDNISILVDHVSSAPKPLPKHFSLWQTFIDRCLAKSPDDRYQTMSQVINALEQLTAPNTQVNPKPLTIISKHIKNRPVMWSLAAVFMLLIVILMTTNHYPNNDFIQVNPVNDTLTTNINQSLELDSDLLKTSIQTPEQLTSTESSAVAPLLGEAYQNINDTIFLAPNNNQVTEQFLHILSLEPDNEQALKGLKYIENKYTELIALSLSQANHQTAFQLAQSLERFNTQTRNLTGQAHQQKSIITAAIKSALTTPSVSALQARNMAKTLSVLSINKPLTTVKNLADKKLNAQIGERFLYYPLIKDNELIDQDIAVSNEITVKDYQAFSNATNRIPTKCVHKTSFIGRIKKIGRLVSSKNWKKGYFTQANNHPVTCININDAKSYATWLSEITSNNYRLPTQQEWLFLANDKNTVFSACKSANHAGQESKKVRPKDKKYDCSDDFTYTAPIHSFTSNTLGLYDIQGNVSEWVECNTEPCASATAMGTSWQDGQTIDINNYTQQHNSSEAFSHIGFRLIRDGIN